MHVGLINRSTEITPALYQPLCTECFSIDFRVSWLRAPQEAA